MRITTGIKLAIADALKREAVYCQEQANRDIDTTTTDYWLGRRDKVLDAAKWFDYHYPGSGASQATREGTLEAIKRPLTA